MDGLQQQLAQMMYIWVHVNRVIFQVKPRLILSKLTISKLMQWLYEMAELGELAKCPKSKKVMVLEKEIQNAIIEEEENRTGGCSTSRNIDRPIDPNTASWPAKCLTCRPSNNSTENVPADCLTGQLGASPKNSKQIPSGLRFLYEPSPPPNPHKMSKFVSDTYITHIPYPHRFQQSKKEEHHTTILDTF